MTKKVKRLVSKSEFARMCGTYASAMTKAVKGQLQQAMVGDRIDIDHPHAVAYLKNKKKKPTKKMPKKEPEPITGVDARYEEAIKLCTQAGKTSVSYIRKAMSVGYARAKRIHDLMVVSGVAAKIDNQPRKPTTPPRKGSTQNRDQQADVHITRPLPPEDELPGMDYYPGQELEDILDLDLRTAIEKFGTAERMKGWLQARKAVTDIAAKEIVNAEKRGKLIPRDFVEKYIIAAYEQAHINLMADGAKTIATRIASKVKAGDTVEQCEEYASKEISKHIKRCKDNIVRMMKDGL